MLKAIFNWFTGKPLPGTEAPAVKAESVPYKVEPPPVVQVQALAPVSEHVRVEATAPVTKKPRAVRGPSAKKPAVAAKTATRSRNK
jgi:hypothetical protein